MKDFCDTFHPGNIMGGKVLQARGQRNTGKQYLLDLNSTEFTAAVVACTVLHKSKPIKLSALLGAGLMSPYPNWGLN